MTAAGVGTTLSAVLLPVGAFLLGTSIARERERKKALIAEFKMKLKGSAMLDAVEKSKKALFWHTYGKPRLNEQGRRAVHKNSRRWLEKMDVDIDMIMVLHGYIEDVWQAYYEKWVNGMAEDLYKIYTDPNMTKPGSFGWGRAQ